MDLARVAGNQGVSDRPGRAIAALRAGHDELSLLVEEMSTQDLTRQSAASEWTIADVLSHLGSGAEIMLATLDGALQTAPEPGPEFRENVWARWNAMAASEQADRFSVANERLVSRFEGLDEALREHLRIDLGFLPAPIDVAATAALRLNEFTYHTWDIQVVFDPAAALAPAAVELLFQPLEMLIGFIGQPDALNGKQTVLAVHTTHPDRSFGLDLRDAVSLVDLPAQATDSLTVPAEAFLRLTAGRLAPEHTPSDIRLASDSISLDDLRKAFPGF